MLCMFVAMLGFEVRPHMVVMGFMLWPSIEINAHKYLLHKLPDRLQPGRLCQVVHFVLHGYHHKFPRDPTLLLWPPFAVLFICMLICRCLMLVLDWKNSISLTYGIYIGYSIYDVCHYFIHSNDLLKSAPIIKSLLHHQIRGHNNHHFNNSDQGGPPYAVLNTWAEKIE